jgi:methoxymalonate biosynthesis acyl carrier protein
MDDRARIRAHLARFSRDEAWLGSDDLFAGGVIDSMMAVELVTFLEKVFAITIDDEDLELANFRSVEGMLRLVQRKRSS